MIPSLTTSLSIPTTPLKIMMLEVVCSSQDSHFYTHDAWRPGERTALRCIFPSVYLKERALKPLLMLVQVI